MQGTAAPDRERARALLEDLRDEELPHAVALLEAVRNARGTNFGVYGHVLGLERDGQGDGRTVYRLQASPHLANPHGILHGGVLFSAMDTAMGGALTSLLGEGERCSTVEAKVNYLAPVVSGAVTVDAQVVHKGNRIAVLEARATMGDGRPAALMTGTFFIRTETRA